MLHTFSFLPAGTVFQLKLQRDILLAIGEFGPSSCNKLATLLNKTYISTYRALKFLHNSRRIYISEWRKPHGGKLPGGRPAAIFALGNRRDKRLPKASPRYQRKLKTSRRRAT